MGRPFERLPWDQIGGHVPLRQEGKVGCREQSSHAVPRVASGQRHIRDVTVVPGGTDQGAVKQLGFDPLSPEVGDRVLHLPVRAAPDIHPSRVLILCAAPRLEPLPDVSPMFPITS